jgi:hypothetical protein
MYTHFKRHVGTLVNVAQAVVRRNQKCLDADGNHFEHLLQLQKSNVHIEYYNFNTAFSFLKMCIHFFDTLCIFTQSQDCLT